MKGTLLEIIGNHMDFWARNSFLTAYIPIVLFIGTCLTLLVYEFKLKVMWDEKIEVIGMIIIHAILVFILFVYIPYYLR